MEGLGDAVDDVGGFPEGGIEDGLADGGGGLIGRAGGGAAALHALVDGVEAVLAGEVDVALVG